MPIYRIGIKDKHVSEMPRICSVLPTPFVLSWYEWISLSPQIPRGPETGSSRSSVSHLATACNGPAPLLTLAGARRSTASRDELVCMYIYFGCVVVDGVWVSIFGFLGQYRVHGT